MARLLTRRGKAWLAHWFASANQPKALAHDQDSPQTPAADRAEDRYARARRLLSRLAECSSVEKQLLSPPQVSLLWHRCSRRFLYRPALRPTPQDSNTDRARRKWRRSATHLRRAWRGQDPSSLPARGPPAAQRESQTSS